MLYLKNAFVFTVFMFVLMMWHCASAQTNYVVIKGRVVTPDGSPALATAELKGAKNKTATDNNGAFAIKAFLPLNDTLVVSSVALETYQKQIVTDKPQTIHLGNLYLSYHAAELQNVEVRGRVDEIVQKRLFFFRNQNANFCY